MPTAQQESSLHSPGKYAAPRSNTAKMTAAPYLVIPAARPFPATGLSIAVIGPDDKRCAAAAEALAQTPGVDVRQFSTNRPNADGAPKPADEREAGEWRDLGQQHDVVLVDLEDEPERALNLVAGIRAHGRATVMVYASAAHPELLMRSMRAGAQEFLSAPFSSAEIGEALSRASSRASSRVSGRRRAAGDHGNLLVFMGAKGGVGVTAMACNFAVALAQQPGQKTLLIDLDLPLGDAALNLGIVSEYSAVNALTASERLDGTYLSKLLVKHSSGLSVLAAPGKFPHCEPDNDALERLLTVARQQFDHVVVDVGSRMNLPGTALFAEASAVYLVTQAGIPELRNSNRLINQWFSNARLFSHGSPKLEIVLNCFDPKSPGSSDEHITRALTRPVQWKIPNNQALMRKMHINTTPLVLGDSPLARTIREMAAAVNPAPEAAQAQEKKKGFSLFGRG